MAEWWPRAHDLELCPFLPFLKIFLTDFSGTMKTRKQKVRINMDNDWMYHGYWNRGQGSITIGSYVPCGQGAITLGVMSLGRF